MEISREPYDDALTKLVERTAERLNKPPLPVVDCIETICEQVLLASISIVHTQHPNLKLPIQAAADIAYVALSEWPVDRFISWSMHYQNMSDTDQLMFPKEVRDALQLEIDMYYKSKQKPK